MKNNIKASWIMGASSFLVCLGLFGLAGCATTGRTTPNQYANFIHWHLPADPVYRPGIDQYVAEKKNDLYFIVTKWKFFSPETVEDRQLTHTPDIKEIDVRVWEAGYITYFAKEKDGGKWYMQPLGGDDSNRKEISADEVIKMGK